jgi:tetratricopeptide (TPR) repeat protein
MRAGDGVILTAELIDVASGSAMGSIRKQTHSRSELFKLADALADEVRNTLGVATETEEQPTVDLARTLTDSPAAYRAYIAGEAALQARLFGTAIEHLQQAVQLDSTFALAYHALAVAAGWEELGALAKSASNQAVRWADRLPERWRTVVRAKRDYEHGNHDAAYAALQQLADDDTDIAEAYYLLGEIAEHIPQYVDAELARTSFEKALELDPSYTIVLFHLITHYLDAEDLETAWSLVRRLEEQSPGDTAMLESKLRLFMHEDRLVEAEILAKELSVTNLTGSWGAIVPVFVQLDSLDMAERLLDRMIDANREDGFALISLGGIRVLQGRFHEGILLKNEGIALLQEGSGLDRQVGFMFARVAETYTFAGDLDAALSTFQKSRAVDAFSALTAYRLGRFLAVSGRDPAAHEAFMALDSIAVHRVRPELKSVRLLLQAEVQLAQGNPDAAWRIVQAISVEEMAKAQITQTWWWLRARVLEARGDDEQALAAYRMIFTAPIRSSRQFVETQCLYPMAKLEEAAGEVESAREHYQLYVKRWGAADVPIPGIDNARARLAALGG